MASQKSQNLGLRVRVVIDWKRNFPPDRAVQEKICDFARVPYLGEAVSHKKMLLAKIVAISHETAAGDIREYDMTVYCEPLPAATHKIAAGAGFRYVSSETHEVCG